MTDESSDSICACRWWLADTIVSMHEPVLLSRTKMSYTCCKVATIVLATAAICVLHRSLAAPGSCACVRVMASVSSSCTNASYTRAPLVL